MSVASCRDACCVMERILRIFVEYVSIVPLAMAASHKEDGWSSSPSSATVVTVKEISELTAAKWGRINFHSFKCMKYFVDIFSHCIGMSATVTMIL